MYCAILHTYVRCDLVQFIDSLSLCSFNSELEAVGVVSRGVGVTTNEVIIADIYFEFTAAVQVFTSTGQVSHTRSHTYTHTHTHTPTHTHTHTHTRTHTHAYTHTYAYTHTHTHTHAHMHTCSHTNTSSHTNTNTSKYKYVYVLTEMTRRKVGTNHTIINTDKYRLNITT